MYWDLPRIQSVAVVTAANRIVFPVDNDGITATDGIS